MSVPAAYLGVIVIWSTTPLAIKWSSDGPGFLFGVASRMVVGLVLCLILLRLLKVEFPWHRDARRTYLVAGLSLYCAMLSVYWGAQFIPSGLISVLFGLTPLITGALASIWLNERGFTPAKVAGLAAGLAGLAVIFSDNGQLGQLSGYGIAAVLVAATIHSAGAVGMKRLGSHLPAMATTTGALSIAVPLYFLTWLVFDGSWPQAVPTRALLAISYLGIMGSAIGFILYFYALKHVEASRVALIPLVTPVTALMIGQWLNSEVIAPNVWIGTSLILSGLLVYEWGSVMRRFRFGRR